MGRLTKRIIKTFPSGTMEAIELDSEWVRIDIHADEEFYDIADKLAHYEDLEEQGRLITLPCALNTKVYYIGQDYKGVNEVHSMQLFTYDLCINTGKGIGEWLFLTKEEAEAKLKELEVQNG